MCFVCVCVCVSVHICEHTYKYVIWRSEVSDGWFSHVIFLDLLSSLNLELISPASLAGLLALEHCLSSLLVTWLVDTPKTPSLSMVLGI